MRGGFNKAAAVFERNIEHDETDAEEHWRLSLCRYGIEYVEAPKTVNHTILYIKIENLTFTDNLV